MAVQEPGLPPPAPQMTSLLGHAWHRLPTQDAPAAQEIPQAPQCVAVLVRSTHVPLQSVVPAGQWHCPEMQLAPVEQALPQVPQLLASLLVLTQPVLGQAIRLPVQVHAPVTQVAPVPHTLPQVPQLKLSTCLSTQLPLHTAVPTGQPHWPLVQVPPSAHLFPH